MSDFSGPAVLEPPASEVTQLRLLAELPSRPGVFFGNLWDLIHQREDPPLDLQSAPAPFWPDVFVPHGLPWRRFFQSGTYHALALLTIWGATHFLVLQPRVVSREPRNHEDVIHYTPAEYLPPLDTRERDSAQQQKADPEYAAQRIISVPREANNHAQTIVTPPDIRLKQNVALPNIVSWSDRPQMPIGPAPVVMASSITRLAPSIENAVVAPAPDIARSGHQRNLPGMQAAIIAPPPDVQSSSQNVLTTQTAVIAPPPSVESASARRLSDINIGRSSVIAPAPRLTLDAQRAVASRNSTGLSGPQQVVAPPPALRASSGSGGGRMIALNLHPAVGAPPNPPAGNRRGTFASTPDGRRGASGTPGSTTGSGKGNGGETSKNSGVLPSGLFVGKAADAASTSPVAGEPGKNSSANSVNPNLIAGVRLPRVSSNPARALQPENETKISEEEREVFRDRKFYSLTLNMPNLNSNGGSWIIRFAELKQNGSANSSAAASDLSAPSATRKVDPAYPLELMRQRLEGTVILFGVIHADGTVGNVRVLRSVDDRLDQYASDALTRWKFQPATKNGMPVEVEATFQIPFRPGGARSGF